MSAVYSATLLVAMPIVSLTDARRRGGSALASSTTAPTPAGPGFPREPPSQKIRIVRIAGSRPGNETSLIPLPLLRLRRGPTTIPSANRSARPGRGSSVLGRRSRARDEDGAAVVAVGHVAVGAGLADPGDLGGGDREPAALTRVADQPGHPHTPRRGPTPVVQREEVGGDVGGGGGTGVGLACDLGVDHAFLLLDGRPRVAGAPLGVAHPPGERGELAVDRLLALHELELAVLERPLVPAELVHLALHGLELTGRGDRARVHRRLDLADLGHRRRRLVLEPLHVAAHDVVPAAHLGDRCFELADHGLGLAEHGPLGQRRAPVPEVVDRAVVLLDHEELLERRRHQPRNVSAVGRGSLAVPRPPITEVAARSTAWCRG